MSLKTFAISKTEISATKDCLLNEVINHKVIYIIFDHVIDIFAYDNLFGIKTNNAKQDHKPEDKVSRLGWPGQKIHENDNHEPKVHNVILLFLN